jgi:hypothetical protein
MAKAEDGILQTTENTSSIFKKERLLLKKKF